MAAEDIKRLDCAVDRIEGNIAVIIPDSGDAPFEADSRDFPKLCEGKAYTAVICGGRITSFEEREACGDNAARLARLFKESKDRNK